MKPFYNKNKSSFFVLNSRNSKANNFAYKDTNQSKTNFISDKVMNREVENDKKINIGNISNLNKYKNMNINYFRERRNSFNSKYFMSNIKNDKSYNKFDINDKNRITNENIENSKIIDFQLPNINNHERNRNKNRNSDIIDFL